MIDAGLDEEDEGYFASITDIMVGLLFVFIIVIMFFALQISEAEADAVPRPEHVEVVRQLDRVRLERDAAVSTVVRLEMANVELIRTNTILTRENERLRRELDRVPKLERRIAELEATVRERDGTLAERDAAIVERDATISELRTEIEELQGLVAALEDEREDRLSAYLSAADRRRTIILREVRDLMREAGLEVEIVEEQGVVRLPDQLLFARGRGTLDDRGREVIAGLGDALARVLPCYTLGPRSDPDMSCNADAAFVETVFVEGHTDSVPVRGEPERGVSDNLDLSALRASNTFRRLRDTEPGLLDFSSVGGEPVLNVSAYGETRPIDADTRADRNRRIDLRFLMHTPRSDTIDEVQALVADAPAEGSSR